MNEKISSQSLEGCKPEIHYPCVWQYKVIGMDQEQLHQAILEEPLDRSRFQKKMLATGLFERLPKRQKDSPGRNPYQYRVKPE